MSVENVKAFFAMVDAAPELRAQLQTLPTSRPRDAILELVRIAAVHGYVFTPDDIQEVRRTRSFLPEKEWREGAGAAHGPDSANAWWWKKDQAPPAADGA